MWMHWALAGFAFVCVFMVSRHVLSLDGTPAIQRGFFWLRQEREKIYEPVALEIETQTVILGISLNEALGEREGGKPENAWRLVGLAVCQWKRLAENVRSLLDAIDANVPSARSVLRVRTIHPQLFRSRSMLGFVHMRNALDQFLFRSKVRYQMNVRVLRRAVESLTSDFQRAYELTETSSAMSPEVWGRLDPAFHDFDLLIKEVLLSFRYFLVALPDSALNEFACDLKPIVSHSVRAKAAAAGR
jgi:hypothetical protein